MNGLDLIIQPDAEDADAAEVFVDGAIGGRPYRFLLDTGAARSYVRYDEYTATFASVATDTSSGVFAGGSRDLVSAPRPHAGFDQQEQTSRWCARRRVMLGDKTSSGWTCSKTCAAIFASTSGAL